MSSENDVAKSMAAYQEEDEKKVCYCPLRIGGPPLGESGLEFSHA